MLMFVRLLQSSCRNRDRLIAVQCCSVCSKKKNPLYPPHDPYPPRKPGDVPKMSPDDHMYIPGKPLFCFCSLFSYFFSLISSLFIFPSRCLFTFHPPPLFVFVPKTFKFIFRMFEPLFYRFVTTDLVVTAMTEREKQQVDTGYRTIR